MPPQGEVPEGLREFLDSKSPEELDITLSVFSGAVTSHRKSSVLLPFPTAFNDPVSRDHDYDRLEGAFGGLPSAADLKKPDSLEGLTEDQISLLQFLRASCVGFERIAPDVVADHIKSDKRQRPNFVFKLVHDPNGPVHQTFERLAEENGTILGFHGSSTENWFSITNRGLQRTANPADKKKAAQGIFGDGIYLSAAMRVASDFSRSGPSWGKSMFGPQFRGVAMCRVVDHPEVKQGKEEGKSTGSLFSSAVPATYILSPSPQYIQIDHLLVYTEAPRKAAKKSSPLGSLFLVLFYAVLILGIVASRVENWASVKFTVRRFYRQLTRGR